MTIHIYLVSQKSETDKKWNKEIANAVRERDACDDQKKRRQIQNRLEECHRQKIANIVRIQDGVEPISGFSFQEMMSGYEKKTISFEQMKLIADAINNVEDFNHLNADSDISSALLSEMSEREWAEWRVYIKKNISLLSSMILQAQMTGEPLTAEKV